MVRRHCVRNFGNYRFDTRNSIFIWDRIDEEIDDIPTQGVDLYRGESGYFLYIYSNRSPEKIKPLTIEQAKEWVEDNAGEYAATIFFDHAEEKKI